MRFALLVVLLTPIVVQAQLLPWRANVERRLRQLEQQQRQQPFIIVPPYQQLPIQGQPKQQLPIQGQPQQPLPIQGQPQQPLPIQGPPQQQLPQQGQPQQQLPQQTPQQIGQGGPYPMQELQQYSRSRRVYAIWRTR